MFQRNFASSSSNSIAFESDLKSIQIPDKFTIKDFEKGGKSGLSLTDTITFRTRLQMTETIKRIDSEFVRLGWTFWKAEDEKFVYCKGKFEGQVVFSKYNEENSTDVFISLSIGNSETLFGNPRPKECKK